MKIPHSRPRFDAEDETAVARTLRDRFVSAGKNAERLGEIGAAAVGKVWGAPTQSGTDALLAALRLLVPEKGRRVVAPAYMCSAPLDALALLGLEAVPIDVDRRTMALDPELTARETDVAAVIIAHMFGIRAPAERIDHENLIEDCAQTLSPPGSERPVGSTGRLTILSFYATKLLTTGHGGLLAGNENSLRRRMSDLFQHDKRKTWRPSLHVSMSDFNAALGLSQFAKLAGFLAERRAIAGRYLGVLDGSEPLADSVYSRFLVTAPEVGTEAIIQRFADRGIEAKHPVFKPLYECLGLDHARFPNAKWLHDHLISVPLHPGMSPEEVAIVESFLKEIRHDLRRWPPA